jgi:hypothetical protein
MSNSNRDTAGLSTPNAIRADSRPMPFCQLTGLARRQNRNHRDEPLHVVPIRTHGTDHHPPDHASRWLRDRPKPASPAKAVQPQSP